MSPALKFSSAAWFGGLVVVLLPILVFWPVLSNGFVNWDDPFLILENQHISSLSVENLRWMFTSLFMTTYQPFGWLAYALIIEFFGFSPIAFHGVSLLLHGAVSGALFWLLWRLLEPAVSLRGNTESRWTRALGCALAVCFWSLHPLQAESVAWATEIPDLLASLFFVVSLVAYVSASRRNGTRRGAALAISLILFAASGLSRWKGFWLPGALILLDIGPLARISLDPRRWRHRSARRVWLEKLPYFIISLAIIWINHTAKGQVEGLRFTGVWDHPLASAAGVFFYAWKILFPLDLWALYTLNGSITPLGIPTVISALGALGITGLCFLVRRRAPELLGAWFLFALALAPTFVATDQGILFGQDHYAYLALAVFSLPLARAFSRLQETNPLIPILLAGILLWPMALRASRQTSYWRDSVTLWSHAVSLEGHPCIALKNLAAGLIEERRFEEAAIRIKGQAQHCPKGSPGWQEAHQLQIPPNSRAKVLTNMAAELYEMDQSEAAFGMLASALQADPNLPQTHNSIGIVLYKAGRREESLRHFRRALKLDPDFDEARSNLERVLASPEPPEGG